MVLFMSVTLHSASRPLVRHLDGDSAIHNALTMHVSIPGVGFEQSSLVSERIKTALSLLLA